jgi:methylsterol monooxygenase/4-alpha-methyl-delta7-sterol-4alpha-methyl oxidase
MFFTDIRQALNWEKTKLLEKGPNNIIGITIILSYFYYFPRLLHSLYPLMPNDNIYKFYVIGTYTAHFSAYVLINFFYFIIYQSNLPYFEKHKINSAPWPWHEKDWPIILKKVITCAMVNQFFTLPAGLLFFGLRAKYDISERFPEFSESFPQVLFFIVCEDFCFYWTHRILHQGFLYRKVHKLHHEFNVTVSIAAEYAHPVEYLLGNSLPVALGPMVFGQSRVHIITWLTWVFIRTMNTGEGHSGYNFPWSPFRVIPFSSTSTFHDFHHYKNLGNYGSFMILWDAIFGTHRAYMKVHEFSPSKLD